MSEKGSEIENSAAQLHQGLAASARSHSTSKKGVRISLGHKFEWMSQTMTETVRTVTEARMRKRPKGSHNKKER